MAQRILLPKVMVKKRDMAKIKNLTKGAAHPNTAAAMTKHNQEQISIREQRAKKALDIYLELGLKRTYRQVAIEWEAGGGGSISEGALSRFAKDYNWAEKVKEYDEKHRNEYERDILVAEKLTDLMKKAREGDLEAGEEAVQLLSGCALIDELKSIRDLQLGVLRNVRLRPRTIAEVATLLNACMSLQKTIELLSGNATERKENVKIEGAAAQHLAIIEARLRQTHVIEVVQEENITHLPVIDNETGDFVEEIEQEQVKVVNRYASDPSFSNQTSIATSVLGVL